MKLIDRESKYFFHTYKRIPLEIDRGKGVYLYSKDGKKYLDMFAGLAVNALGYNHPQIIKAVQEQTTKYLHISNYYLQEPQIRLAGLLIKYSGYSKVFLTNSGTEAIECAIKIVRKWGAKLGKHEIVSFSNAYHGRTMGALSLTNREKYRTGFGPLLPGCTEIKFNNTKELRKKINGKTLALFLEFIQGESGVIPASKEFIGEIKELRKKYGFLVVADEIQTGLGRTGKLFSFQHYDAYPDIVVIAKSLGGGLPLGAVLGNKLVENVLEPGTHGSTFGGNPVACAAGIVVLNKITAGKIMKNAERMGKLLKRKLTDLQKRFPDFIREVRGCGLMLGIELKIPGDPVVTSMREKGILINCTNHNVLRFLPPLIIKEAHIKKTIDGLTETFKDMKI